MRRRRMHGKRRKRSPLTKQNLSPKAAADKAARDLEFAKTAYRKDKKAENQRRRREAGNEADGMDWDHKDNQWETPRNNRGNGGKGTKSEGPGK